MSPVRSEGCYADRAAVPIPFVGIGRNRSYTGQDRRSIDISAIIGESLHTGGGDMNRGSRDREAISAIHTADLERAVRILQEEGCREIYLFGSVATGDGGPGSDIDIGIRDYPRERFFHIYGRLLTELEHETDLVDFGHQSAMFSLLSEIGEVRRIA
jgi:predicted nucleotidyltransferase